MSIAIGKYRARCAGLEFGETQEGNEFVQVAFDIPGHGLEPWRGYLTDKAVERTIKALRLMGWAGSDLAAVTAADLPGWVQVDVREDKDRDGNVKKNDDGSNATRIAWVNSLTGLNGAPLSADKRKALALRLRKAVADAPVVAPVLQTDEPKKPPREPGDDGDDMPPWL